MSRIQAVFQRPQARAQGADPFITAGDPDAALTCR